VVKVTTDKNKTIAQIYTYHLQGDTTYQNVDNRRFTSTRRDTIYKKVFPGETAIPYRMFVERVRPL